MTDVRMNGSPASGRSAATYPTEPAEVRGAATQAGATGRRYLAVRRRVRTLLEEMPPGDRAARCCSIFLVALIGLNVAAVVLESVGEIHAAARHVFYWFEVFSVAVFTVEYVLRGMVLHGERGVPGRGARAATVRGPAAAVDAQNTVGAIPGRFDFPREMAAPDLCGAQFADALGNAQAFDVIGIVADLRAVVVPIGETANGGRQKQRGSRQPSH